MKKLLFVSFILFVLIPSRISAQFVLNGNATTTTPECSDSTPTFQLTPDLNDQAGEIWYTTQVSLANRFDISFELYLGNKVYSVGADGICFVFQQQSVNAGSNGGGMGYGGITPSLAIEFDTYQNAWDPAYCHTAIEKNGDVDHTDNSGNNLAGPVQLSPSNPNLPDGNWHNVEIIWNPVTDSLSMYFDCAFRIGYKGDVVTSIFGGNPNVYWGFTGGTGGSDNTQEVCVGNSYLNNLRDTSVCTGQSVTLTAQGGASYTWSPASGLNTTTSATVIATPTATTTYTVSIKNACGLISLDSVTVAVNQIPTATMLPPTDIICGGTNTGSATVVASGGTSPYTYTWLPSGGSNATASGLSAGTYTVTVSDGIGCTSTNSVATVTITQPPPLIDSIASSTPVLCNSTIGSATIGVKGGTGAYTYSWSPGGYTTAFVTGLAPGTYTVTVTDASGCPAIPSPIIISIVHPPALGASIASRVIVQCEEYGYITAQTPSGGTPPYTYSWAPNGGTNMQTVTTLTAGTYTLTVTDSNGCSATAAESITYPPMLTATPNLISEATCYGEDDGKASVTPIGGNQPYTYSWFPAGGTNATAESLSAGTYIVTVTDSNGCTATADVTITQAPGMVITTDSVDVSIFGGCVGEAAVTVVSGGVPPYTYLWSPGGQTTDTIKGQCEGAYCCTVTGANGCSEDVCVIITDASAVANISSGNGPISIYPNPSNGLFTISGINREARVEIYDVLGQNLHTQTLGGNPNKNLINLSDKASGVYFYRVVTNDGSMLGCGKIVIQR
jgi:hypothetical protein